MQKGFTLFELATVLLISSILLIFGVPAASDLWERNLVLSEVHLLEIAFSKARRRAVVDNFPIVVCSLDSGNKCERFWNNKIDIFKDENKNQILDANELYIRTHTLHDRLQLTARLSAGRGYLRFNPDGTTHGTVGSFQLCNPAFNPKNQRAIIVSMTGRLRRSIDRNNDGLHEAGSRTICQ